MARDRNAQLRNLIAGYGDSIRLSDIKANIAVLFVAIMIGTVLGFRANYPWYLKVPVLLAPFIVIFFCLLLSVTLQAAYLCSMATIVGAGVLMFVTWK